MPRIARATSIDEVVRRAIAPIVAGASEAVARAVAQLVTAELESKLTARVQQPGPRRVRAAVRRPQAEMTKWVADRRARRVPTFVMVATGLDTKKKIVAKFGENAAFEKGKPLPALKASAPGKLATTTVRARPSTIRRAAGMK